MVTMTVGGATDGNCATGSVSIPSTPRNRRMMEITIAIAGRCRILVNIFHLLVIGPVGSNARNRQLFRVEFLVSQNLFRIPELVFDFLAVADLPDPLEDDL